MVKRFAKRDKLLHNNRIVTRPVGYGGVVFKRFEFISVCMEKQNKKTEIEVLAEIVIF